MKLYHDNFEGFVDCHPSQVENMKAKGWVEQPVEPEPQTEPETESEE